LDMKHLAEEIEDLGSEQEHAVESYLVNLLLHLLKWRFQSERRDKSWWNSIRVARQGIDRRLRRNPSLKTKLDTLAVTAYADARELADDQTEPPISRFPEACPWTPMEVLDRNFWPEAEEAS
jgi:Domain of unknown function DUF29